MHVHLEKVLTDLKFPEGPVSDGQGQIYCSNCDADYITRLSPDGSVSIPYRAAPEESVGFTFKKTNGLAFFRDGSLFACDFGRNAIIRIRPDGVQESYADNYEGSPLEAPNDLAFDPQGNLYFTAPGGSGRANPTGPLYRVEYGTRKITRVATGMAFPNGLAFTADAKFLYVCESQFDRILRFAVAPDGALFDEHVFAELASDGPGEPDGMALDAEGNLWITHYGRHTVLIVSPHGTIDDTISLPVDSDTGSHGPTNLAFAGPDLTTVYITDPGTSAMYRMQADRPGLALFCAPEAGSASST